MFSVISLWHTTKALKCYINTNNCNKHFSFQKRSTCKQNAYRHITLKGFSPIHYCNCIIVDTAYLCFCGTHSQQKLTLSNKRYCSDSSQMISCFLGRTLKEKVKILNTDPSFWKCVYKTQRGNFLLPLLLDNSSVFIYLIIFLLHVEEMLCDFRAGVMSQNLALKHTISFWDPAVIFRLLAVPAQEAARLHTTQTHCSFWVRETKMNCEPLSTHPTLASI